MKKNCTISSTRSSNIELLRIICMLLIIIGHIIMNHHDDNVTEYFISHILRPFTVVGVNVFVIISGYFGINYKTDRLIRLFSQTWFYSVTAFFIVLFLGLHTLNLKKDILVFFPVFSNQYWFVTTYIALYCIAPIINKAISSFDKENFSKGLLVGFILFYIWPTFAYLLNANQLVKDAGYGIVNFVYLYLLGRYIRLYYNDNRSYKFHLLIYISSSLSLFVSQYILSKVLNFEFSSWISYNTFFVFISAVSLFLVFKNLILHSSIINKIASLCLAVYLFHMARWETLANFLQIKEASEHIYILMLIVYPVLIYACGFFIETIRLLLFDKFEKYICNLITSKLQQL